MSTSTPPSPNLPPSLQNEDHWEEGAATAPPPPGLGSNPLAYRYNDIVVSSGVKMGTTWLSRVLMLLLKDKSEHDKRDNDGGTYDGGGPTASGVLVPTTNAIARMTTVRT
jgi:hypothetical protein